jgi:UDP-glucose 4-epimerase
MGLYVVTGGAGFIGSHLATALVQRGDRVRVVDDLSSGRRENLEHLELGDPGSGAPVELSVGSVVDAGCLRDVCRGADGIFHEAAQVSVPASIHDPLASYSINVMGTLQVLEAARAEKVERVVFAASSAAYGNSPTLPKEETMPARPLSPYASGKLAGESMMAVWGSVFGLKTVALRYFNVYGPRQADDSPYSGVIALFARAVLAGTAPTIYGDGEQTRDFVFVTDVVQANLLAMQAELDPGSVVNVGTGNPITINELFQRLAELAGYRGAPRHAARREGEVLHSRASLTRAKSWLGFEPRVDLRAGLAATLTWYRESSGARASR